MTDSRNGYVFINKDGQYACVVPHTGHGTASHVVRFVSNINEATVFTNPNAYYGTLLSRDSRDSLLKHCQPLKASTRVQVLLTNWSDNNGAQN